MTKYTDEYLDFIKRFTAGNELPANCTREDVAEYLKRLEIKSRHEEAAKRFPFDEIKQTADLSSRSSEDIVCLVKK